MVYVYVEGWNGPVRMSTDVSVQKDKWDPLNQRINGRTKDIKRMNILIQHKKSLASEIITDYFLMKRDLAKDRFKTEFSQPHLRWDFLGFWKEKMEEGYNRRLFGDSNYLGEQRSLRKITEFSKGTLSISEITRAWLEKFDAWHSRQMEKTRHKGITERARVLKHIKKYYDQAIVELGDKKMAYPFTGFKMPKAKSNPISLEEEELLDLLKLYRDPDRIYRRMVEVARADGMKEYHIQQYAHAEGVKRIQRIMRKFLFQCVTGMRYGDLMKLEFRNISEDYMNFVPEKTEQSSGKAVRFYLTNTMRELIGQGSSGKIFRNISNTKYNAYLKEVAKLAGIKKRITSHVGRHTFATMGIQKGVPLPILIDLMGLSSVRTLLKYVHTNQQMRDDYVEKVFGEIE